ncbi:hypothetical protein [Stakelama pacifica]|uniref:HEPN domain-containing protein n=1 Tax=Stakelama pacifica TaxID=517720 RepID=A0A4V6PR99_9SPHN|nr:hypothetical protein [Stakelama pacifica]TDN83028.1 hypothetical protein EV664_105228 [Stakelama pacifica]GGO94888.1 hypothetical protein GCM10011329_17780 [Stakelama pacifica]
MAGTAPEDATRGQPVCEADEILSASNAMADGEAFGQAVLKNVFEIWFTPEIERRRAAGLIGGDFILMLAQAIFPEEGSNEIRLNDEVRGIMTVESQRPIDKGGQVLLSDLGGVQAFELIDEELDCGHFTAIRRGESSNWMLSFNALAGRKKASNLVRLAGEFLVTTKLSMERGHSGPSIDNLFSCCELLAKAELIMHRFDAVRSKRHGAIGSAINQWGKLGNVHPQFVSTMNRMSNLRAAARYEGTTNDAHLPTPNEIEVVEAYLTHLRRRSSAKLDDSPPEESEKS